MKAKYIGTWAEDCKCHKCGRKGYCFNDKYTKIKPQSKKVWCKECLEDEKKLFTKA